MSSSNIHIGIDHDLLAGKLGYYLEDLILQKLNGKSMITIGLSGGSMINLLASMLPRLQLPWARLRFFFVDERFVPFTSNESTYGNYQSKLFRQLPLTEKNIIKINSHLNTVEQCAEDYQKKLEEILNNEDKVRYYYLFFDHCFNYRFSHSILFYSVWDLMDIRQVFFPIMLS
jgi:6-phosphogluconolactonase